MRQAMYGMKAFEGIDTDSIAGILETAGDRLVLLEPEGLEIVKAMGIAIPDYRFLSAAEALSPKSLPDFPRDRVVIKVVSPHILHKSDVGGVEIVPNDPFTILATLSTLVYRFRNEEVAGFLLEEFIPYPQAIGHELLLGMRWTEDFGPVVTMGLGGIYAEYLSENLRKGRDLALFSPWLPPKEESIRRILKNTAVGELMTCSLRGQKPRTSIDVLLRMVQTFLQVAERFIPSRIGELEINPLVLTSYGPVALDVVIKKNTEPPAVLSPQRPISKIKALLEPRSIGVIGVSSKEGTPGRIILRNLLQEGYPQERIFVVKPGTEEIEGCRCHRDIASLPEILDLLVVCVSAAATPQVLMDVIAGEKAQSLIVIPGGFDEKEGGACIVAQMKRDLEKSRSTEGQGPVINGGNCLGIRSLPGCYDTFFIPDYKLPRGRSHPAPLALIAQSGAFAISRMGKLAGMDPLYTITCGNQMDLTFGDYLEYFLQDPRIEVVAAYIEGFKPLDGYRFLKSAAEISAQGKSVVVYRAGRTASGAKATASHTASIAGDYVVAERLAIQAGVVMAETLEDFEDLAQLFTLLRNRQVRGWNLGAVSNAGFECVSFADCSGQFEFAHFQPRTMDRLQELFHAGGIHSITDIHNPLDLTPVTGDDLFADVIQLLLDDPGLDALVVGCTPLTAALQTLPCGEKHREDILSQKSIAMKFARLWRESKKPWIVIVDGGPIYDPMARLLRENGIPVFRIADRAMRLFHYYFQKQLLSK